MVNHPNDHKANGLSTDSVYQASDTELQEFGRPRSGSEAASLPLHLVRHSDEENRLLGDREPIEPCIRPSLESTAALAIPSDHSILSSLKRSNFMERWHELRGWRVGVALSAALSTAVLIANLLLTLWASFHFGVISGIGTAYEGNCETAKTWSLWLHIVINALSSALLGASNYTMQCASAPTREECDEAHEKCDWLDIGVVSIRNLTRIDWRRRCVWIMLALSSFPIHLIYNSTVFLTLDANNYKVIVASSDFLESTDFAMPPHIDDRDLPDIQIFRNSYVANASNFELLDNEACINTYAKSFVSGHDDLVTIMKHAGNASVLGSFKPGFVRPNEPHSYPYDWMCSDSLSKGGTFYISGPCDIATVRETASAWTLAGEEIDHCVARTVERHCKLQFSLHLLVVVLVFNLSKCVAMLAMLWYHRKPTFVVWGDAMSSWLDRPDGNTEGRCLVSRAAVRARYALTAKPQPIVHPGRESRRALNSVSRRRWTLTICLCALALIITIGLFGRAYDWVLSSGDTTMTSLGFGAVDSRTIVDLRMDTDGLVGPVLVANSPQVILSAVYLLYNGLFTGMQLVREYSKYEMQRKALRVTTPRGEQRSTYWLQLPYKYSVPLLIASAVLHWLISQAIFLVRVSYNLDEWEMQDEYSVGSSSFTSIGISPAAILSVFVLGSCLLMVAVGLGFRKDSSHIPMAASCSFALAAAAHRPVTDSDAAIRPLQWGEVPELGNDEVGHCCFTSHEVFEAKMGRKYAGVH